jgi:hypothetical protein
MRWKRADAMLPQQGEEVLIRSRGIFQLAAYNENERVFIAKNGDRFRPAADLLWSGMSNEKLRSV